MSHRRKGKDKPMRRPTTYAWNKDEQDFEVKRTTRIRKGGKPARLERHDGPGSKAPGHKMNSKQRKR